MKWKVCPSSSVQCYSPKVIVAKEDFSFCLPNKAENPKSKLRKRRVSAVRLNMYDRTLRRPLKENPSNCTNNNAGKTTLERTTLVRTSAIRKAKHQKRCNRSSSKSQLNLLMSRTVGVAAFREYLASEYSENNLDFWIDCEKYRHSNEQDMESVAGRIVAKYLKPGSPHEVNLNYASRKFAELKAAKREREAFANVQDNVFNLMNQDSFLRFKLKYPSFMAYLESLHKVYRTENI
uniref:RGS domain-containing protein n=1 Tax=Ciona savignyi TaxID=51511 RepID=H2Z8N2_CIOSA